MSRVATICAVVIAVIMSVFGSYNGPLAMVILICTREIIDAIRGTA